MKNKTTVIFGYITFIALIVCGLIACYLFYIEIIEETFFPDSEYDKFNPEVFLIIVFLIFFPVYSGIHYLIGSQFWKTKPDRLRAIEYQNEVLKKEIEQKELIVKLGKDKLDTEK